ncbi:MAG TPA: hypothetical protein VD770_00815, partial [Coxiellaceae bacterium]|nr:hypothetical protein [Coxiellaceae bacterium]
MRVVDIAVVRDKLNNQIKDLRNKLAVYENLRPAPIVVEKSSDLTAVKEEVKKLSNKMKGLARTAFKTSEEVARRKAEEDAARAEHARAAAQSEEDKRRQLEDAKILVEHATQVLGNSFNSYLLQGCITVNSNAFKEALADVRFDLKSLSVADWKRARDQMKKIAKSFPESVRGKLLSKIPEEPPKLIAEYAQSSVPISTVSKHHPQLPTGGLRRHANMDAENERMLEA